MSNDPVGDAILSVGLFAILLAQLPFRYQRKEKLSCRYHIRPPDFLFDLRQLSLNIRQVLFHFRPSRRDRFL
jgi:hypothetical protein